MSDLAGPFDAVDIEEALREGDKLITLKDDTTLTLKSIYRVDKIIPSNVTLRPDQSLGWNLDTLDWAIIDPSDVIAIDDV
jgi:hypothetical protein